MKVALIAFTKRGFDLARRVAEELEEAGDKPTLAKGFGADKASLSTWTKENFATCDALIFVGAAGIATRSISPYVKSKLSDPAVVVMDEAGQWCIPILSGHVGGANDLARRIADLSGAQAVITTGTDISGLFSVDSWAVSQGLVIANPHSIEVVSGKLLSGSEVTLVTEAPITGRKPKRVRVLDASPETAKKADVYVGISTDAAGLRLIPVCVVLGMGCRRGTPVDAITAAASRFLSDNHVDRRGVCAVASIDLKADEQGLVAFARKRGFEFLTFPAEVLAEQQGEFTPSEFVSDVTGVDNVCERAAVAAGGTLVAGKTVMGDVTVALAIRPWHVSF